MSALDVQVCPNDVGYSCSGKVESALLFSAEPTIAPCAKQSTTILWAINILMLALPGVFGMVRAPVLPCFHERNASPPVYMCGRICELLLLFVALAGCCMCTEASNITTNI